MPKCIKYDPKNGENFTQMVGTRSKVERQGARVSKTCSAAGVEGEKT